jgi:hypothetical protein
MYLEEFSKLHVATRETTDTSSVTGQTNEFNPELWTTVLQVNGAPEKDA